MIDTAEFNSRVARLRAALGQKLHAGGRDLEHQIRRAGRRLPRRQRRAAAVILGAQDWMGHPRLARIVDRRAVAAAFDDLHGHLERIDPGAARLTAILRLLAGIVVNLMLLGAALYLVLSLVSAS